MFRPITSSNFVSDFEKRSILELRKPKPIHIAPTIMALDYTLSFLFWWKSCGPGWCQKVWDLKNLPNGLPNGSTLLQHHLLQSRNKIFQKNQLKTTPQIFISTNCKLIKFQLKICLFFPLTWQLYLSYMHLKILYQTHLNSSIVGSQLHHGENLKEWHETLDTLSPVSN